MQEDWRSLGRQDSSTAPVNSIMTTRIGPSCASPESSIDDTHFTASGGGRGRTKIYGVRRSRLEQPRHPKVI